MLGSVKFLDQSNWAPDRKAVLASPFWVPAPYRLATRRNSWLRRASGLHRIVRFFRLAGPSTSTSPVQPLGLCCSSCHDIAYGTNGTEPRWFVAIFAWPNGTKRQHASCRPCAIRASKASLQKVDCRFEAMTSTWHGLINFGSPKKVPSNHGYARNRSGAQSPRCRR